MTPFIEVSHLPSSASFYAAVTQPVGIKYLSAGPDNSLNFGLPQAGSLPEQIFFNLRPRPCPAVAQVTFSAPSEEAIIKFHKSALLAGDSNTASIRQTPDQFIAETQDMDGNLLRVEYTRAPLRSTSSPTVITMASSTKEAKRVLDWQYEVAASNSDARSVVSQAQQPRAPTIVSRAPTALTRAHTMNEQANRIVQRQTITTTSQPAESNQGGFSSKVILGTILAAAAGAAVGYAMTRSESQDDSDTPVRRASFEIERTYSTVPRSEHGLDEPDYMAHYSKAPSNVHRELTQIDEEPRPYIARSHTMPAGSVHSRHSASIAPSKDEIKAASKHTTLALMPPPSHVSSRSKASDDGKSEDKKSHKSNSHASYSTAKTSRSKAHSDASTLKPSSRASKASKAKSHRSTSTVTATPQDNKSYVSAREVRLPASSVGSAKHVPLPESEVSARQVPLPASRACSVAPSDSISNIGSRRSGRSRS